MFFRVTDFRGQGARNGSQGNVGCFCYLWGSGVLSVQGSLGLGGGGPRAVRAGNRIQDRS